MIVGGIAACPADVLVEISHLHIELFAAAIAQSQVSSVLIKYFSIDGRRVSDIEEDLILDGGKKALCKRAGGCGAGRCGCIGCRCSGGRCYGVRSSKRNDGAGEVAEPACIHVSIMYQRTPFCMVFGDIALLEPKPVGNGGVAGMMSQVSGMGIGKLLPGAMFGQIACNAAGYTLLGYVGIADGAGKRGCEIKVDAGTKQQGIHLAPLIGGSELGVEVEAEFWGQLIILKCGKPACELRLCMGRSDADDGQECHQHGESDGVVHPAKRMNYN